MGGGPEEGGTAIGPETRLADDGKRCFSGGRCVGKSLLRMGGVQRRVAPPLGRELGWRMTGSAVSAVDVVYRNLLLEWEEVRRRVAPPSGRAGGRRMTGSAVSAVDVGSGK